MDTIIHTAYKKACYQDLDLNRIEPVLNELIQQLTQDILTVEIKNEMVQINLEILFECVVRTNLITNSQYLEDYYSELTELLEKVQELDRLRRTTK